MQQHRNKNKQTILVNLLYIVTNCLGKSLEVIHILTKETKHTYFINASLLNPQISEHLIGDLKSISIKLEKLIHKIYQSSN